MATDDIPAPLTARLSLDQNANFFLKDPQIPQSYVVVEKEAQLKTSYTPAAIGTAHPTKTNYYLYEESVTDIGNGIFEITSRYAAVPPTWYSYESFNVPYLKYLGVQVTGSGPISIVQSFFYSYLNAQSIEDIRNFDESIYANSFSKSGTINVPVRVKHEYYLAPLASVLNGSFTGLNIANTDYISYAQNGSTTTGIDTQITYLFSPSAASDPVFYEAGKYVGNIYFKKTYEIVNNFNV